MSEKKHQLSRLLHFIADLSIEKMETSQSVLKYAHDFIPSFTCDHLILVLHKPKHRFFMRENSRIHTVPREILFEFLRKLKPISIELKFETISDDINLHLTHFNYHRGHFNDLDFYGLEREGFQDLNFSSLHINMTNVVKEEVEYGRIINCARLLFPTAKLKISSLGIFLQRKVILLT